MIKLRQTPPPSGTPPELRFPLRWTYRAVVDAADAGTVEKLNQVLIQFGFHEVFVAGNISKQGRYSSFRVEVEVPDKTTMNLLGDALARVPGVKFLL